MRPFPSVTAPARFRRLRRLAEAALPAFGLEGARLSPLTHWENATFRVHTDQGDRLLRVHRPGYRSREQIQGELGWLTAMGQAGLPVQRPLGPVVAASAVGVPEERLCTLLSWQPGRIHRKPTPALCRRGGAVQARLHDFAEHFREPLVRPVWDCTDMYAMPEDPRVLAMLTPQEWADWEAALERLQTVFDALGKSDATFGLVHQDLHFNNLVFHGDQVSPIDFDDGGWGYFALDFAVPYSRCRRLKDPDAAWHSWLEGYRSVRPLEGSVIDQAPQLAELESLMVARWLDGQTWRSQVAGFGKHLRKTVVDLRAADLCG